MKIKTIIPAAGFGTRLNMPLDKSKELLLYKGKSLIEHHLELCKIYHLIPHVITRKEKKDLIDYCNFHNISCQVVEPQGEWPNTVLMSESYWEENNILMLPDTIFKSVSVIDEMKYRLREWNRPTVIAVHKVEDGRNWGCIDSGYIIEKPTNRGKAEAWGLIGFKKEAGNSLFKAMSTRNVPFKLENNSVVYLDSFEDVTREPGKLL